MAIHSSTLAWKIPWTEEPDRLQSMGLQSRTLLKRLSSSSSSQSYGFPVVMYGCESWTMLTKKDVQLESCELSFICGKVRTAAREAASQIALRVL